MLRFLLPILLAMICQGLLTASAEAADKVLRRGSFVGQSRHATSGEVRIVERAGKVFVILGKNFSHDGAPDPKVAFGKNGFVKGTIIGKLKSLSGEQTYEVPASLDARFFNQVYIWCEQFAVPLGVASLD